MTRRTRRMTFHHPEDTAVFARHLGPKLGPGDVILLDGPVGAGKTHLARALIKSILVTDEDVPSPTFTLVQTYDGRAGAIWHTDLYRLSSPHEIEELGLVEAFETSICVVEWPDRLGAAAPADALRLSLSPMEDEFSRQMDAVWDDDKWIGKLAGAIA